MIILKTPQSPKAAPNQAQMTVIPETALELEKELGSGAFGTVHKVFLIKQSLHLIICS